MATLVPARDESVNFDTTENLIIEGDNLEVLKLLQKAYLGKVKMIYIAPPYNTGYDFIYPDNYSESLETYLRYTGQVDNEGRKFSTNTDADDHLVQGRSQEDVLYELLLKSGFPLDTPIEKVTLASKAVFSIAEGMMLVCLEHELTWDVLNRWRRWGTTGCSSLRLVNGWRKQGRSGRVGEYE